ncbi:MAG TPA: YidC/Oxa1 family membrane protein insertase [Clostridia bacterium]|nr:YidC/Oxa1 family membrane protein insertase [Clostridia bacterium]
MGIFANILGYVLNWLYMLVNENYGIAIILFSVLLRIILLPVTYKQQISMKKTAKIQKEIKKLQIKYKNNSEQLNKETMELYKKEKMSPFSGCISLIVQMVLILSVFWLVSQPLTYMKSIDKTIIEDYKNQIKQENGTISNYSEIEVIQKKSSVDERVKINMEFLGLDLSKVPNQNLKDVTVYIIPLLYIISSIISIRITTMSQEKDKKEKNNNEKALVRKDENEEIDNTEAIQQMSKTMTYFMPLLTVWIAFIAPLSLALYWFVSNVLMIAERLLIKNIIDSKEDKKNV